MEGTKDMADVNEHANGNDKHVWKVALTGGVCAGKTSSLAAVSDTFSSMGFKVFIINETSTELRTNGVVAPDDVSGYAFQRMLVHEQLWKEKAYMRLASTLDSPVLVLCDRGVLDGKTFLQDDDAFRAILDECGTNESDARMSYDGIVYLVTAAEGASEYYGYNNPVRTETPEQAIDNDHRLRKVWEGHPNLCVIDNDVDTFDDKVGNVVRAVESIVGVEEEHAK